MQEALFYSFRIEDHVPRDHLLRSIDRFVDLTGIREHLRPFYSSTGRPSIDPELVIRTLLSVTAWVSARSAGCARRSILTLPIAGSVALVEERGIGPHIPVFEKSARSDATFARSDFTYDHEDDSYICPGGNRLRRSNRHFSTPRSGVDEDGSIRHCVVKVRAKHSEVEWWRVR